jgi:putative inorganic carbon (hco3(-)) transporter
MTAPQRLAYAASLLFLAGVPWALPATAVNEHDTSRIVQIILLLLCALLGLLDRGRLYAPLVPHSWRWRWLLLGMMALAAASVAQAASPVWAFKEVALWLGLLAVAAVFAQVSSTAHWVVLGVALTMWVFLGGLVDTVFALAHLLIQGHIDASSFGQGFAHPRFFNHTQTIALPLASVVLLPGFPLHAYVKRLAFLGLALGYAALFFTMGRGTWVGLIAAMLGVALAAGRQAWPLLRAWLMPMALGLLLFVLLYRLLPLWVHLPVPATPENHVAQMGSVQSRFKLWRMGWDLFLQRPWLGQGPMHFTHESVLALRPGPDAAHPHNAYLQLLAEWGLPFALGALAFVGRLLARLRLQGGRVRALDAPVWGDLVPLWLLGCMLAALVDACFSGNLVMPVSQVWFAVALGLSIGASAQRSGDGQPPFPRVLRLVALAVAAAGIGLGWSERAYLLRPVERFEAAYKAFAAPQIQPRLWAHGWFR